MNAPGQIAKARTPERIVQRALFHSQLLQRELPTESSRRLAPEIDERIRGNGETDKIPAGLKENMLYHQKYYSEVFRTLAYDVAQRAAIEANIQPRTGESGTRALFMDLQAEFAADPHLDQYHFRVALLDRLIAGLKAREKLHLHRLALEGKPGGKLLAEGELREMRLQAFPDPALAGIEHKTLISAAGDVIKELAPHIDKLAKGSGCAKDAASDLAVRAYQALWKVQRYLENRYLGKQLDLDIPPKSGTGAD